MISAPGIGSGLDVNAIVDQLMAVERIPLNRLEARKAGFETQISAYGRLQSALSTFQSAMGELNAISDFKRFTATSADETVYTATASSDAVASSYAITVQRIAEQHKMGAATTYADTDTTTIGTAGDTMTIGVGGNTFTVDIGARTLGAIRDAINAASDNTGVSASIISDDAGNRLVLTADDTGSASELSVSYSGSDPFALATLNSDRDSSGSFTAADLDAVLTLEGQYTVTSTSNTVTDALQGVTLNLKASGSANLVVDEDIEGVTESVQSFIDAYNELRDVIDELHAGDLAGDSTVLSVQAQLQAVFNTPPTGLGSAYNYLSEIGITTNDAGDLELDTSELETALLTDYDGVANLFANDDQGYAYRLEAVADDLLSSGGLIESRTDGLESSVDLIDGRIESQERRLELVEERYRAQFTALDVLMGEMQATSQYLTQQLAALPGVVSNNNG